MEFVDDAGGASPNLDSTSHSLGAASDIPGRASTKPTASYSIQSCYDDSN